MLCIERNQAVVEGGVMKAGEAEAVARIEPLIWKFPPRFDVARDEKTRDVDATNTAANPVRVENGLTKELLASSYLGRADGLSYATGSKVEWGRF